MEKVTLTVDVEQAYPDSEKGASDFLELVAKHKVLGTFFVIGGAPIEVPEIAKAILAEGHEVGSHGCNHPGRDDDFSLPYLNEMPKARMEEDVRKLELTVYARMQWLNWRCIEVPRQKYRMAIAGEETRLLGVAVYRITKWNKALIATFNDLFLAPDSGVDEVESSMFHIYENSEKSGCAAALVLASPRYWKLEMLKRAGFMSVPSYFQLQPFPIILREHTASTHNITVEDMDVSFGICDLF